MADFVFVHGGMHDAWCWDLLRAEMEARGHRTWATDLPIDDAALGAADYARRVADDCHQAGSDAVLVGHSLGGLTIPLLADVRGAGRMVFLSAGVPEPGTSFSEQLIRYNAAPEPFPTLDGEGRLVFDEATARSVFYHDCSGEVADEAVRHLRPQGTVPMSEIPALSAWPEGPVTTIHGLDDRLIPLSYAERASARIGSDLVVTEGGHSLFLSRPAEVADHLEAGLA